VLSGAGPGAFVMAARDGIAGGRWVSTGECAWRLLNM
jgi:hypothetical protein